MNARRGYVPDDDRNFSKKALETLRTASKHVCYLINEGYPLKPALTFVGNHFLLSQRQRLAIGRSVATKAQLAARRDKEKTFADLQGKTVWIDGFNQIITLEVMLSDGILLSCMDGTIRDLAGLRGTYRMIDVTDQAIMLMLGVLQNAGVKGAHILLDAPISNSGRLKTRIAEISEGFAVSLDIQIIKDVDKTLYDKDFVITSDSVILDACGSWFNLMACCLKKMNVQPLKVWQ